MASIKAFLGLDSSPFEAGLNRARAKVAAFGTTLSKTLQPGKLGSQLAGAFTIGALGASANRLIDFAGGIEDTSKQLGISTDAVQQFDYALKLSGTSLQQTDQLFVTLRKSVQAAREGNVEMAATLSRLGVSARSLKSANIDEIFLEITDATKEAGISNKTYTDLLQVMGKSATQVLPAIAGDFRALSNQAREFGLILDKEAIARLDELGDARDRALRGAQVFGASAIGQFAKLFEILGEFSVTGKLANDLNIKDRANAKAKQQSAQEAVNRAQQEADILTQVADLQEKNEKSLADLAFDRLSTEEKILRITAFRVALMERLKSTQDPLRQQQFISAELAASKELESLNKSQKGVNIRPDLNALQQVGAFTAQRTIGVRPEQIAQKQLDTLSKIEQNTRASKSGTITFP